MHNSFLGAIALLSSIYCFVTKRIPAGIGFLLLAVVLTFSFLITITTLPVDAIGVAFIGFFAVGCFMILYQFKRGKNE